MKKKNYIIIDSIVDKTPEKTEKLINFCAPKEPSEKEKESAKEIVGKNNDPQGISDLFWILAMHPEFQLIQ